MIEVIAQSDGWADSGSREAQAHSGIHGTYHRYDVVEWWEPSSCEYTADYAHPVCPVNECASGDGGHECRIICKRIDVEGGSGAWECPHHGFFRVFDYPSDPERETEQATLLTDGGVDQGTEELTQEVKSHDIGMMIGVGMFANSIVILLAGSYTDDPTWSIVIGVVVALVWTSTFAAISFADNHMPHIDV